MDRPYALSEEFNQRLLKETREEKARLLKRLYEYMETLPMSVFEALKKHTNDEGVINVSLKDLLKDAAANVGMQEPEE